MLRTMDPYHMLSTKNPYNIYLLIEFPIAIENYSIGN
jgi:hypothetical protein